MSCYPEAFLTLPAEQDVAKRADKPTRKYDERISNNLAVVVKRVRLIAT